MTSFIPTNKFPIHVLIRIVSALVHIILSKVFPNIKDAKASRSLGILT